MTCDNVPQYVTVHKNYTHDNNINLTNIVTPNEIGQSRYIYNTMQEECSVIKNGILSNTIKSTDLTYSQELKKIFPTLNINGGIFVIDFTAINIRNCKDELVRYYNSVNGINIEINRLILEAIHTAAPATETLYLRVIYFIPHSILSINKDVSVSKLGLVFNIGSVTVPKNTYNIEEILSSVFKITIVNNEVPGKKYYIEVGDIEVPIPSMTSSKMASGAIIKISTSNSPKETKYELGQLESIGIYSDIEKLRKNKLLNKESREDRLALLEYYTKTNNNHTSVKVAESKLNMQYSAETAANSLSEYNLLIIKLKMLQAILEINNPAKTATNSKGISGDSILTDVFDLVKKIVLKKV